MQRSNKKGSGGAGADRIQPWHPNFRNTSELPDIKTVRTKFFINAGCVILALVALLCWLYAEYNIRAANQQLASVEQDITRSSKGSKEAILHYKKFKDDEGRITELSTFLSDQKLMFSDFIISIGQSVPEHVTIDAIQLREADVSVRGVVKSAPELASSIASAYEKQLRDNPEFAKRFGAISLTSLARDSATGFLNFEMVLKLKK